MPDDEALPLEPFPTSLRAAVIDKPYRKYDRFALNTPERMPLPAAFQVKDPAGALRATVDRLTAEHAAPAAPKLPVDGKLQELMEQRSPQFTLRNIPRVERIVDPWLEFTVTPDARPDQLHLLDEARQARLERPELLESFSVDAVREYRAASVRWVHDEDWTRHFSRELKDTAQGPLWRNDPNAVDPSLGVGAASRTPTPSDARQEEENP